MVHFLVDTPEKITREFRSKFVVDEVMIKLIKLSVLDKNIQKVNVDLGFALKEEIKMLNKKEKAKKPNHLISIKASKTFFLHYVCNHLLTETPLQSQFTKCCCCFNLHFMVDYQSSCNSTKSLKT